NGQPIEDSRALSLNVSQMSPGTTVKLRVAHEGKERDVSLTLAEMPTATTGNEETSGSAGTRIGISVEPLTSQLSQQLGLPPDATGVLISDVDPGTAAEEAGLQRGDVVQEVNHKSVTNIDQFRNAIREAGNQQLLLLIDRGGNHRYVVVEA